MMPLCHGGGLGRVGASVIGQKTATPRSRRSHSPWEAGEECRGVQGRNAGEKYRGGAYMGGMWERVTGKGYKGGQGGELFAVAFGTHVISHVRLQAGPNKSSERMIMSLHLP